jgi:hypothetical protein
MALSQRWGVSYWPTRLLTSPTECTRQHVLQRISSVGDSLRATSHLPSHWGHGTSHGPAWRLGTRYVRLSSLHVLNGALSELGRVVLAKPTPELGHVVLGLGSRV